MNHGGSSWGCSGVSIFEFPVLTSFLCDLKQATQAGAKRVQSVAEPRGLRAYGEESTHIASIGRRRVWGSYDASGWLYRFR